MIVFERNVFNSQVEKTRFAFDCYNNNDVIGKFEVYKNHYYDNKQEIYIEVFPEFRKQGFGFEIYKSFLYKFEKLGFKDNLFYAVVVNSNKKSLKLHNRLCKEFLSINVFFKDEKVTVFKVTCLKIPTTK